MSLSLAASKVAPTLVAVGAVSGVVTYVARCLAYENKQMDRAFSTYRTPEAEASRRKTFEGASYDPRNNIFNVLGWKSA